VLDEPSVVTIRHGHGGYFRTRRSANTLIQAVGAIRQEGQARCWARKQDDARPPGNIVAIRPMKDGVIADFTVTEQMLKQFIKKVHDNALFSPQPAHHHLRALRLDPGRAARDPRERDRRRRRARCT
jgi:rod shape-determining protein MreB and related proteins